ncbi:MAG TPA: putative glycoside hydrolase, partial [Candidatus Paceibacterota bacterium]
MRGFIRTGLFLFVLLIIVVYYVLPPLFSKDYIFSKNAVTASEDEEDLIPTVRHLNPPEPLKGIYMSACYAGSKELREGLAKLIDDTELNAIVIDIKDYSGKISFLPNDTWKPYLSDNCNAPDMKDFIQSLHDRNIYVIGRITVFQDPFFAKQNPKEAVKKNSDKTAIWHDRKGISYLDPGSSVTLDHIVALAKDSYDVGFDEINFDYIRFPSDGPMNDIYFPYSEGKSKPAVMEGVYKHLHDKLKPEGV